MHINENTAADILIPVYKPDDKLECLLQGLSRQSERIGKVIIMYTKQGLEDIFPKEIFDRYSETLYLDIHELERNEFDHGGTRALGMEYASSDVVICMTQDAIACDKELVLRLVLALCEEGVVAAYARQMPGADSNLIECFTREFNYPAETVIKSKKDIETMGIKAFFCSNVCAAYNREVYCKLGGFIKQTIFNEDMIFARKIIDNGYKICYCSQAKVIHTHNYTAIQQFHRNFDLAVSQAMNKDVFEGISSESEGIKYVKTAYSYFSARGKAYLMIPFLYGCCFKYLGYKLGKKYDRLPMWLVTKCSMNSDFFKKN